MNRRRFVEAIAATCATARNMVAALASVGVSAAPRTGDSTSPNRGQSGLRSEDAESDWIARSTAAGVLWAHDFRDDAEFQNFHRGYARPYQKLQTAPAPMPYHAALVSTPFGVSRAIRSAARGTVLTQGVPPAKEGDIQTWHVADASEILEPWDGEYRLIANALEYVLVQSVDHERNTVTVRRTGKRSFAVGNTLGTGPQGRWIRPTACFPAGMNGKSTPDQGLVSGSAVKERRFTTHAEFREGYFGHRSYWDPTVGSAPYKDWKPDAPSRRTRDDAWEGDEFWLQFRARVSASRAGESSGKMLYIQNCTTSGNGQLYIPIGPKSRRATDVPPDWPHGDHANFLRALTCWGSDAQAKYGTTLAIPQGADYSTRTVKWADGKAETAYLQDPHLFPQSHFHGHAPNDPKITGWHIPVEKWVTYLVHMKLGRDSIDTLASGILVAPGSELVYDDKSVETIYLDDVSPFPDPAGAGNYPYIVHTRRNSKSPRIHEHMEVIGIDRSDNSLTVRRNKYRSGYTSKTISSALAGLDVGSKIAYGPTRGLLDESPDEVFFPYGVERDPRLGYRETTVELFVAVEGESDYTRILSHDRYAWLYGDMKPNYGHYFYNPPGLNSIELSQYINDYIGSGAVPPPTKGHHIDYTQAILSRNFIPAPSV